MKVVSVVIFALICYTTQAGRTIQWTGAGGNPLWEFPLNWDCNCVPTTADDVIINLNIIPGNVRISATPATCNSLTVGGNSPTLQTLTVQGPISIGSGGGKILSNGIVILNAGTDTPFSTSGKFDGDKYFQFMSGTLAGAGSFTFSNINFTGPALKVINASTTITQTLFVDPGTGAQGVINVASSSLSVMGTLRTLQTLTISSLTGGKLSVPGTLSFQGSAGSELTVRGSATITNLNVYGGTVTLNDNVNIMTASVSSGATINMIGATGSARVFNDVAGMGTLNIQGGSNTFHGMSSINSVILSGGSLVADSKTCNIGSLTQSGGIISGTATVSASSASLSNANIVNTPVTVSNLELKGFTSMDGSTLTVTGLGIVSGNSQLTLANTALFYVTSNAKISQSASLQILPAGTSKNPSFRNEGKWTSTSTLTIDVKTLGAGSYSMGSGSSASLTGINFNAGSVILTSATLNVVGSVVTIGSIDGNGGVITVQGESFVVNGVMNVGSYVNQNGMTQIATGTLGSLDLKSGLFNITGPVVNVGNFQFEGGQISSGGKGALSVSKTIITTNQPKTISSIRLTSTAISISCGSLQCQLFTQNASFETTNMLAS